MNRPPSTIPNDGIFRAILTVMLVTVIGGVVLAMLGDYVFHNEAMKRVGTGAALIGGFLYFFFRVLGKREAKRRQQADDIGTGENDRPRD